jgi:transposase-like protein
MLKVEARSLSRAFKLDVVRRMEAGENVSAPSREVEVKREVLYRWRDAFRLGVRRRFAWITVTADYGDSALNR